MRILNLKSKIFKIIPIWLIIALALSGTAVAAVTWISNSLTASVNVTKTPVTLGGTFNTNNRYAGIQYDDTITYTVNNAPTAQGYILLSYYRAPMHGVTLPTDVSIEANGISYETNTGAREHLYCLSGYPKTYGSEIYYLFGVAPKVDGQDYPPATTPFNFAIGGATSGTLHWYVTYNVDEPMNVRVQVTSTLPEFPAA